MSFARRRTVFLLVVMTAVLGFVAIPSADAQSPMSVYLAQQIRFLRPRIVHGRILLTTLDPTRSSVTTSRTGDKQERLVLSYQNDRVSLTYELTTPQNQLLIEVTDGNQVMIRRLPGTDHRGTLLKFAQPAQGDLTLELGEGPGSRRYRGATLWHLLFAEPEVCRQELLPLVQLLNPAWGLAETATALEAGLKRSGGLGGMPNRTAIVELVHEMADPRFAKREAAERKLLAAGEQILPLVRGIDRARLDAEQTSRLERVVRRLSAAVTEDTPATVLPWLAADPYVWCALLSREDESLRRMAAAALGRLLDEPIAFDPAADEATRKEQLKALQERLQSVWHF
jgi:hypothetical protein